MADNEQQSAVDRDREASTQAAVAGGMYDAKGTYDVMMPQRKKKPTPGGAKTRLKDM